VQAVIHANLCMRLVELLSCKKDAVLVPALRTVGNIVTGTDEQTQAVLNCNALAALYTILANSTVHKKSIIKEACWTVSNITAGTREQIESVIESGCIEPIVHLLKTGELEIKREAAWAISNATSGGDARQIQQLVQLGCIPPLTDLLRVMDPRIMQVSSASLPECCMLPECVI
jgi:importin subunit alpha-6/7